jgi:hypothetical protein
MRRTNKPVRKCYTCPLNLGDRCWIHEFPRGQWRHDRTCPTFDDPRAHERFRAWQKQATVKTGRELRRESFRARTRKYLRRRGEWPRRGGKRGSGH